MTEHARSERPIEGTGGFQFELETEPNVYRTLAHHQAHDPEWDCREYVAWLQTWTNRFVEEFALDVREIALCVEWLPKRRLGHFRSGVNGFGLKGEIALNRRYLATREPWQHLGTLLHELLHAWQEEHGKPGKSNYHNKEFRERARSYGLVVDTKGHTQYEPNSPFFDLLDRHGVEFPGVPPIDFVPTGRSKNKKWSCRCTPAVNVRAAVAHFRAVCLWCGHEFQRRD